jgi:hypothetical protein
MDGSVRRGRARTCTTRNNPSIHPALLILRSCQDVRPPHPREISAGEPTHAATWFSECVFDRSIESFASVAFLPCSNPSHPCWIRTTARCSRHQRRRKTHWKFGTLSFVECISAPQGKLGGSRISSLAFYDHIVLVLVKRGGFCCATARAQSKARIH